MTRLTTLFILLACGFATAATEPTSRPAESAPEPLISLSFEIGYPPPGVTEYNHLIAGFWSDGTVVWTTNTGRLHAGKP